MIDEAKEVKEEVQDAVQDEIKGLLNNDKNEEKRTPKSGRKTLNLHLKIALGFKEHINYVYDL